MLVYSPSASDINSSSSVIAPISIALSSALSPPPSLIDVRAPLRNLYVRHYKRIHPMKMTEVALSIA